MKTNILFILFIINIRFFAFTQIPIDNPYATKYGVKGHWTDSLKWKQVTNASSIKGLWDATGKMDSALMQSTLDGISKNGGGVLFFPAGSYYFHYDLGMANKVVIRGATPKGITDAKMEGYEPPTKFIFPKYQPSFSGTGTPNNTAFKVIWSSWNGGDSFGLVNLDINRANISCNTNWPSQYNDKVIIFGIRQNNAALADPGYPSKTQIDEGYAWQRWPAAWHESIGICIKQNCVVANCRLNDNITDDFEQPNYMTNDGIVFKDPVIKFRYNWHEGVEVKSIEPGGSEILDNYLVFPKEFPGILADGKVSVKENLLIDSRTPELQMITIWDNLSIPMESVTRLFKTETFKTSADDSLVYKFLKPENYNPKAKYPLVLFLHGEGEKGYDKDHLRHFLPQVFCTEEALKNYPCFILAPHLTMEGSWLSQSMDNPPSRYLEATINLVNATIKKYNIDKSKVYITGISSGGTGAWEAIIRYPHLFAAAAPLACHWSFTDDDLKKIKKIPVWISAGIEDIHIPIKYVQMMHYRLEKAQIKMVYNELPGIGHFSWVPLYKDPAFSKWIFSQRK